MYSFLLLSMFLCPSPHQEKTADFVAAARLEWGKYLNFTCKFQGSTTVENYDLATNKKGSATKWLIKKANGCSLFDVEEYTINTDDSEILRERSIYGYNSHYQFTIGKNSKLRAWQLTKVERYNPSVSTEHDKPIAILLCCGGKLFFPDILEKKGLAITGMTEQDNNSLLLTMKYDEKPYSVVCNILIDKQHSMVVKESRIRKYFGDILVIEEKIFHKYTLEDKMPVPVERVWDRTIVSNDGKTNKGRTVEKYNLSSLSSVVDMSEFVLSNFDLPEPSWLTSKNSIIKQIPWYLYITFTGIICMVLASFILYCRGKQAVT